MDHGQTLVCVPSTQALLCTAVMPCTCISRLVRAEHVTRTASSRCHTVQTRLAPPLRSRYLHPPAHTRVRDQDEAITLQSTRTWCASCLLHLVPTPPQHAPTHINSIGKLDPRQAAPQPRTISAFSHECDTISRVQTRESRHTIKRARVSTHHHCPLLPLARAQILILHKRDRDRHSCV